MSIDLVADVYRATQRFPDTERFGLVSQLRRASVSIASNIAEGQGRLSKREFRQFLGQARGSLLEVQTQLYIGQRLGYISDVEVSKLIESSGTINGMLNGLMESLEKTVAVAS